MSKKNNVLSDADLSRLMKIPLSTLNDWKRTPSDNWRNKLYYFLKSHSYSEIELRVKMISEFQDKKI